MENKLIVFSGKGKVMLQSFPIRDLRPDEILIRNIYSGISSGTERMLLLGDFLGGKGDFPLAPGYQAVGYVKKLGSKVKGFKNDDLVCIKSNNLASEMNTSGSGCHSQYILALPESIFKLPKDIDVLSCSMAELVGVGLHSVQISNIEKEEKVVVIGLGMLGQITCQLAKWKGAKVIGVDGAEKRLKIAKKCGIDYVLDRKKIDIKKEIENIWKDLADVVFETTARKEIVKLSGELLGKGGRLIFEAYYPETYEVNIDRWHWFGGITVYNPTGPVEKEKVVDIIHKEEIKIKPLITHIISPLDAEQAYELLLKPPEESLGIVFEWSKL